MFEHIQFEIIRYYIVYILSHKNIEIWIIHLIWTNYITCMASDRRLLYYYNIKYFCTVERSYVDNWGKNIRFPSSIKYSSYVRSSHEKICVVEKHRKYAKLHAFLIINITKILMKKCKMHDFIEWHWFYEVCRIRDIWRKMNNVQRMNQSTKVPI